jgi:hypothetical protein
MDKEVKMRTYVLIANGEAWATDSREQAMDEARGHVIQYICDHLRHQLPLELTEELVQRFDVQLACVGRDEHGDFASAYTLPFQEWVDEYHRNQKKYEDEERQREYETFVKLRSKWEGRFQEEKQLKEKHGVEDQFGGSDY